VHACTTLADLLKLRVYADPFSAVYRDRQAALVLHPRRRRADDLCRAVGQMEGQGNGRGAEVMHDAGHRAERFRCRGA
jgi:hypothetical protein